jgi:hypothetical protein
LKLKNHLVARRSVMLAVSVHTLEVSLEGQGEAKHQVLEVNH